MLVYNQYNHPHLILPETIANNQVQFILSDSWGGISLKSNYKG